MDHGREKRFGKDGKPNYKKRELNDWDTIEFGDPFPIITVGKKYEVTLCSQGYAYFTDDNHVRFPCNQKLSLEEIHLFAHVHPSRKDITPFYER